ncbi:Cytochrome B561 [Paramagnetospirillum magnetotacticum MS-1]|uniref:Cytochrome B561 n=1 Tax=Paramagnetospirillum magnetotacticum MS-1 TaxID=272627 RepID=A0A0C2V4J0_PARME|nr:cytochrome b [Paramagnetospirillum magnetotacticum]KIM00002.1 Cytochrome B561 [Paramagnetospirillum magnetotacticum MS-1]
MTSRDRYDGVAMGLHWLMAAAIIVLLVLGFVMIGQRPGSPEQFKLYQLHKSVGVLVFGLAVLRLGWRLGHRPPPLPDTMGKAERLVAHAGHWALYGLMLGLPLAGWVVVSTSPYNIPTVIFGMVGLPHLPLPRDLNTLAKGTHLVGAWVLIATLVGHVTAALRHHFVLRDQVLARMLPRFGREK